MHLRVIDLRLCLRLARISLTVSLKSKDDQSEEHKLTDLSLFLGSSISSVLPFAPNTVRKILVSVPAY